MAPSVLFETFHVHFDLGRQTEPFAMRMMLREKVVETLLFGYSTVTNALQFHGNRTVYADGYGAGLRGYGKSDLHKPDRASRDEIHLTFAVIAKPDHAALFRAAESRSHSALIASVSGAGSFWAFAISLRCASREGGMPIERQLWTVDTGAPTRRETAVVPFHSSISADASVFVIADCMR